MALRLLPFRQYAETDVINMFALQEADLNEGTMDAGSGDAGVWVKVTQGGLNDGPTTYDDQYQTYLGMNPSNVPYVGRDQYPRVTTEVGVANSGDNAIGVTLYQTCKTDENGQKLLYYPQKKLETQSVLPGESVPVLSRGIISVACGGPFASGAVNSAGSLDITEYMFAGNGKPSADIIGYKVGLRPDQGADFNKGQLYASGAGDGIHTNPKDVETSFGRVLATGSRVVNQSGQNMDQFAGNPSSANAGAGTGYYAIIQFDTNNLTR
jgi:hypothetical protein